MGKQLSFSTSFQMMMLQFIICLTATHPYDKVVITLLGEKCIHQNMFQNASVFCNSILCINFLANIFI